MFERTRRGRAFFRSGVTTIAVAASLVLLTTHPQASRSGSVTVQLLAINDFHGNLEPPSGGDGRVNQTPAGGAEYLATHLARARAENRHSILVAAGDIIGASPLVSSMYHDEATIAAMNAMNLSVSAIGNHELDEGPAELLRMKRGGCHPVEGCSPVGKFRGAKFEYLSANVVHADTQKPLFAPVAVKKVGGVKIGFIGETLKGTPQIVSARSTSGLTFLDEATTANAYADQLQRQGVHAIVLLLHEGGRQAPERDLDPNGCEHFSGGIEAVVTRLSPAISVVISGHNHLVYSCRLDGHLVTNAGAYGRGFTRIALEIDRASGRILQASPRNETVTRDVPRDPEISRIIAKYKTLADAQAKRVVGRITADIVRRPNAAGESALGDLIADSQLEATRSLPGGGAAVAFMNSGGIRADLVTSLPGSPGGGDVTYGQLMAVQPFNNVVTVMTMTGEAIRRVLEQQFDNPRPGEQAMLQVSRGFSYRYRANAPSGQHVEPGSIRMNGSVVESTDRVRVAASDFLFGGGDGFTTFADSSDIVGVVSDIDAFAAYVREHSPVSPEPQNRVIRVD